MSSTKEFLIFRILPLIFVVVGTAMVFFSVRDVIRAKASANWPAVHGEIITSSVERHYSTGGAGGRRTVITYAANVLYAFSVDGKSCMGNRVSYKDYSSESLSDAYRVVNRYPKGRSVKVYYMPNNPKVCVLEPGIQQGAYFTPGLGLLSFVLGSLMAIFGKK